MRRALRWLWATARRPLGLLILAILIALAAYEGLGDAYFRGQSSPKQASPGPPPVPVHAALVEAKRFPVVLNGLGTVQATNTVTVRSRVDGQIEKVAFEEGQMVREGDLLVQIDAAPFQATLNQAIAKKAQDEASLTNARQDLERTTILSRQGNATQQLLDQRTATVASLTAQVQADDAAIASARVQLAYTIIRSPLTGRAGFRLVDPGNIVHASDVSGILTITQLQPISVVFTATEQDLPTINEALNAGPLKVTALSSDGRKTLGEGTLKLVDNQVDVASGTIKLKAVFDNPGTALWPGLSVATRLLVRTLDNVVVVPDSAVQRGPNGLYAYLVTAASKAEMQPVKISMTQGGQSLLEDGLKPGDRIVTAGHYRVVPGGPLRVLEDEAGRTAATPIPGKVD